MKVPQRTLGKTGERISVIGLGGAHITRYWSRRFAVRLVREAIDRGITFMDNCWDYSGGRSERWMGDALAGGYRDRVFLMTKIDGRTRDAAARQIDQSLERLQTDYVDLMQLHEVIRWDDPERIFAPGGAIEALTQARDEGKIRYVGFTGHKDPGIHLKMLNQGFDFDAVQMPLNVLDAGFNSFQRQVLPVLVERRIGVLAMKPMAAGRLFHTRAINGVEALQYVMNLPVDVVITGMITVNDLDQAIEAAATFQPLSDLEVGSLLARMAPFAHDGSLEGYKTSHDYDGTYWHPSWLEKAKV